MSTLVLVDSVVPTIHSGHRECLRRTMAQMTAARSDLERVDLVSLAGGFHSRRQEVGIAGA